MAGDVVSSGFCIAQEAFGRLRAAFPLPVWGRTGAVPPEQGEKKNFFQYRRAIMRSRGPCPLPENFRGG